jgi:hypothetical protein
VTNHPTVLTQKTGRENQLHSPLSGFSPTAQFQAKPHLVGNERRICPTYCGCKKIFKKSCGKVTGTIFPNKIRQISRRHCANGHLFAAVNKKFSAIFFAAVAVPGSLAAKDLEFRVHAARTG